MIIGIKNIIASNSLSLGWLPTNETSLTAWYRNKVGITLQSGTTNVSEWADSSTNTFNMLQSDTGEQPSYGSDGGNLTFDSSSDTQNLQLQLSGADTHITLEAAFVIGIKMDPTTVSTVIVGSNTLVDEMIKIQSGTSIRVKNNSDFHTYTLDSGNTKDDSYWVISRDDSNYVRIHKDGSENPDGGEHVINGVFDINAIGVRKPDNNPFNGDISEIMIFNSYSKDLVSDVNNRLSEL